MTGYIVLINLCSFVHIFVCLLFRSATTTLLLFNEEVPQPKRAKRNDPWDSYTVYDENNQPTTYSVYDENGQRKDWAGNMVTRMDDEMKALEWNMAGSITIRDDPPAPIVGGWGGRPVDGGGWGVPSS